MPHFLDEKQENRSSAFLHELITLSGKYTDM